MNFWVIEKIFRTQCIEIRSDAIKHHRVIKHPSWQLNGNLTLIFMIRCKYYKKTIICGICFVIAHWADLFIAYIAFNPISTFLRQFSPGDLANFAGSTIINFFIAVLIIRPNCCIAVMDLAAAPPEVFLHWQPYLMVSSLF